MEFEWIGGCKEGSHDKIWAVCVVETGKVWCRDHRRFSNKTYVTKYATIWGRRGKALQSKVFEGDSVSYRAKIAEKQRKGYTQIDTSKLKEVYPEFQDDLEKAAFWATLKG